MVYLVWEHLENQQPQLSGVYENRYDANNLADARADFATNERYRKLDSRGMVSYAVPPGNGGYAYHVFVMPAEFGTFQW